MVNAKGSGFLSLGCLMWQMWSEVGVEPGWAPSVAGSDQPTILGGGRAEVAKRTKNAL